MRRILLILLCLVFCQVLSGYAIGQQSNVAWWRLAEKTRLSNGQITATLELCLPSVGIPDSVSAHTPEKKTSPKEVEIFYCLDELLGIREGKTLQTIPSHTVVQPDEQGRILFTVSSGKSVCLRLWAKIRIDDRVFYAQTMFGIFGDGNVMPSLRQGSVEELATWPAFVPLLGASFYRAQTENPLELRLVNMDAAQVGVLKNGLPLDRHLTPDGKNCFSFTPPYDDYLARTGPRARQFYTFVACGPEESVVTFTVPVYRGYHLQLDYSAGLTLLGVSAILPVGIILAWRRRFNRRFRPSARS